MSLRGVAAEWFTALAEEVFNFVRVRVSGDTIRVEAVDDGGSVFDRHTIDLSTGGRPKAPTATAVDRPKLAKGSEPP